MNFAPCFIGSGTLTNPRDMIRALETLESLEYRYEMDGNVISEGSTTLVKLMYDNESATARRRNTAHAHRRCRA